MMEESTNPEESSNAITIQVDVHHRHYSQLSASIATTSHDCVNEPETTCDLPSIHRDYPKTAAQRMAEYRARKKKETPIVNHRKHKKSDAERAKEYRARKKAKIQSAGNECKERWKNLRAVFVRHLKPGSGNKTNKPYYLAESMQFALPFIKTLNKGASAAQRAAQTQPDTDSDHEDSLLTPALTADRPSPSCSPSSQPALPSPQPCNYWRNASRRAEEEQDALAEDKANGDARDPREDANRMFLLSLLPDMNQMTPSQVRSFKRKALESLDDILEGVIIKQEPE